jgi:hypothetical protein
MSMYILLTREAIHPVDVGRASLLHPHPTRTRPVNVGRALLFHPHQRRPVNMGRTLLLNRHHHLVEAEAGRIAGGGPVARRSGLPASIFGSHRGGRNSPAKLGGGPEPSPA